MPRPSAREGYLKLTSEHGRPVLLLGGRFDVQAVDRLEGPLEALTIPNATELVVDGRELEVLDTIGALALHQLQARLGQQNIRVKMVGLKPGQRALLDQVAHAVDYPMPRLRRADGLVDTVASVGRAASTLGRQVTDEVAFLGKLLTTICVCLLNPRRLRLGSIMHHLNATGVNALGIVGLLSFLLGVVLAYQSADQLRVFGAEIFVVNLLGISILREIGVLITAIIVAGRSGSAFTAELGTMKVNQEIDAMRTIGLDPMEVLIVPRTLALLIALPLLTFYANILGLVGGATMTYLVLDITPAQFVEQFSQGVKLNHLQVGLIKAPFFAFVIAMVGCFQGLTVGGNAESVGRNTTQSVVQSIFLVISLDAILSIVFSVLRI